MEERSGGTVDWPFMVCALNVMLCMEVSIDGGRTRCHFFISETKRDFD